MRNIPLTAVVAVSCLVGAACERSPQEPSVQWDLTVTGRLYSPVAADLSGLYVRWSDGLNADSSAVTADGQFSVRAASTAPLGELLIDQRGTRQFHPFLYPLDARQAKDLAVVMVPRQWTVQRGIYAGEAVPVSLDLVMDYHPQGATYYNVKPLGPEGLEIVLQTMLPEMFPLQVAVDRSVPGDGVFAAGDSVEMWKALRRMEQVFGRQMFDPVVADPSWFPTPAVHDQPRVVRVRKRSPIIGLAVVSSSSPEQSWEGDLGAWAEGPRTHFRVRQRWLNGGELHVGDFPHTDPPPLLSWAALYTHEMMHILGVGHTSRFPTPMGPGMRTDEPSKFDVAFIEMKQALMLLQREHDTVLGIVPATIGQRKLELGLTTLPDYSQR